MDVKELTEILVCESSSLFAMFDSDRDDDDCDGNYIDVRLQSLDGSIMIHTGDSQYDTSHAGSWAYGSISREMDKDAIATVAEELLEDLQDAIAINSGEKEYEEE